MPKRPNSLPAMVTTNSCDSVASLPNVAERADAAHLQGEADGPEAEDADRVDEEVHAHRVGDVLRAGQPGLDEREAGLHEHDEEAGEQGPDDVDRRLGVCEPLARSVTVGSAIFDPFFRVACCPAQVSGVFPSSVEDPTPAQVVQHLQGSDMADRRQPDRDIVEDLGEDPHRARRRRRSNWGSRCRPTMSSTPGSAIGSTRRPAHRGRAAERSRTGPPRPPGSRPDRSGQDERGRGRSCERDPLHRV